MKRILTGLLLALSATTMTAAHAGQLGSLAIIDQQTGQPIKIWRHAGQNYVAGQPGQRYTLQVTNKTGARLLSVVALDGINVITGATASTQQSGYVLESWQQQDIAGWRKNMDQVAAFYFTNLSDSYAGRTGRGDQTGVIGVALYREKVRGHRPEYRHEYNPSDDAPRPSAAPSGSSSGEGMRDKSSRADAAGSAARKMQPAAPEAESKLGTGHGERIDSASRMTEFQRASTAPAEVLTVYYDSYANLVARGIIPRHRHSSVPMPSPFPGGFVPDPSS